MITGFGANLESGSNIAKKRSEIENIVRGFFQVKDFNQRKIYQAIVDNIGNENIDHPMLNFAIKESLKKMNRFSQSGNPDPVEIDRSIQLIVDWSLIKIKSQQNTATSKGKKEVKIGSNQPKGLNIDSLL